MSTGSLSTCRAAGWMKIDRETKAVEGQEGRERERESNVLGLDALARRSRERGGERRREDVRGGRAPRLNSA